jgi:hypothetical protein
MVFEVDLECMAEEYMRRFVEKSLSRELRNRVDGYFFSAGVALAVSVGLRERNLCDFEIVECQVGIPIGQWWEFNVWPFGL